MSVQSVLLPVFVQVALTFFLLFWMGRARFAAVRTGQAKVADLKANWASWPERPTQISAAYHNQFQIPVLFYAVVIIAIVTAQADLLFVVLSWLFVLARILHAYVHTGRNDIRARFRAFALGVFVLLFMWLYLLLKLFVGL